MGRRSKLMVGLLAAFLLTPATASAWFVDRGFGGEFGVNQLTVIASPGETNHFQIFVSGASNETGTLSVFDKNSNPVTLGGACGPFPTPAPGTGVGATCGSYAQLGGGVFVTLADGNDRLEVVWPFRSAGFPMVHATGEDGNDEMIGGQGVSRLEGGFGNDIVGGEADCCGDPTEAGNDIILGGPGDDKLVGGDGDDEIDAGDGNDRITADSGDESEGGNDTADGGAGNDLIFGNGGSDRLLGDSGIDRLIADDGFRDRQIDCGPGANKKEEATFDGPPFIKRKKRPRDPKPISCGKPKVKTEKKKKK